MYKQWSVDVDIRPNEKTSNGWQSLFRLAKDNQNVLPGSRAPAVFFQSGTTKMMICSTMSGNPNSCWTHDGELALNEWTNLRIAQSKSCGLYHFTISIGEEQVYSVVNTHPEIFFNMRVYAGDRWSFVPNANLRNLHIDTFQDGMYGEKKYCFV